MNEHDSERIAAVLAADGMEPADSLEDADVVVLNTCCIRQNADDKLYGHLGHLKALRAERPELQIAVGGCLAQKDREDLLRRAPHVDAVFGTFNVGRVADLLGQARTAGRPAYEVLDGPLPGELAEGPGALPVAGSKPYASWVTIQVGCDNSCAFCIVPSVRGPEVSRPFGDLVAEAGRLAATGTSEITLLGQNVNSYGRDLTTRLRQSGAPVAELAAAAGTRWASSSDRRARPLFADLLRAVGDVPGIRRVRFTSPHPKDLRPETIQAMAETPAVCEQLHLPLQSGSNAVLRAMRRGYTAERYLERLAAARRDIADLAVTTDIIVGFPGENDDDFNATLEVAAEAAYDSAYTFIFSPRAGTRAAEMADAFVDPAEVADRFARLSVVIERSALARNQGRIGRSEEVLIEGPSKKDATVLTGRTRQGKLVHFRPPAGHDQPVPGSYGTVLVERAAPHHLTGQLTSLEQVPRSAPGRVRIPVSAG